MRGVEQSLAFTLRPGVVGISGETSGDSVRGDSPVAEQFAESRDDGRSGNHEAEADTRESVELAE